MYLCICHEIMDGMTVYLMVCPFAAFHRNLNHATKIAVLYIYICMYVCVYIYIWTFPKMEVPLNHPFKQDFPL